MKCPSCGSSETKKKGFKSGVQRYLCRACNKGFTLSRKPSRFRSTLWQDFVFNRCTIGQLAAKHGRSIDWIRKELRTYQPPAPNVTPRPIIAVMDCVFFGRASGYLVVRDPHHKENVYWSEIEHETLDEYRCARDTLESLGFVFFAVVAEGKPGLKPLYEDLPIQMCHFHMKAIITRYLTRKPKLEAGKKLRELVHDLGQFDEQRFARELASWHEKWRVFLAEKTVNPETGKCHYTHKRLRSAYTSLKRHLPYLFAYQRHPELHIPNTTNGLEGSFAYLKELVRVHRGIKADLKRKIITSILQNRPTKS